MKTCFASHSWPAKDYKALLRLNAITFLLFEMQE